VAAVDAACIGRYQRLPLYAVVREGAIVADASGRPVGSAGLGAVFPAADGAVLWPVRDEQGQAHILPGHAPAGAVRPMPLPLTPRELADVGNQLMGQPYGWGGMYGLRDCSSMLRDMFTPFGVWLPRNSAAQAGSWERRELAAGDKEEILLRSALPFATLLWLPGHIGLYVGEYEGRVAVFHDFWGVRTLSGGVAGRYVVGRVLISGLRPGAELPQADADASLSARLLAMSVLADL
jgi:hypothetical protein